MINGRIAVYLLIISYVVTLGHNFIPHHHHHEGQDSFTHFGLHHSRSAGENDKDHEHDCSGFFWIFSNIHHYDDDGLIVHSSPENGSKSFSLGNAFGLLNETSIFQEFSSKIRRIKPPENKSYFYLYQNYSHGLRAPPAI